MKLRPTQLPAILVVWCTLAAPAFAGISPYVRFDYGGNGLRMTDGNSLINDNAVALQSAGYTTNFKKVGPAYGPSGSFGVWVAPTFRVGATYSFQRSIRTNGVDDPSLYYSDNLDFRTRELGGEAMWRWSRLAGLSVGATAAQCRAELIEHVTIEDASGQLFEVANASRTRMSYGGFIGLDQTNPQGVAGFVRVGFRYRDMAHMPSEVTMSDGVTTSQGSGRTVWMDYSGFYFTLGMGYDFMH
jgi:hypothetical protein